MRDLCPHGSGSLRLSLAASRLRCKIQTAIESTGTWLDDPLNEISDTSSPRLFCIPREIVPK